MITAAQLRAARALLGIDQQTLASMSGVSVSTIQRMEANRGNLRGTINSQTQIVEALNRAGVALVSEAEISNAGGCGVRMKTLTKPAPLSARNASDGAGNVSS